MGRRCFSFDLLTLPPDLLAVTENRLVKIINFQLYRNFVSITNIHFVINRRGEDGKAFLRCMPT
jgi:hypothetical protein